MGVCVDWEYPITELVYRRITKPVAKLLSRWKVNPNAITVISALVGFLAAFLIYNKFYIYGVFVLFLSQLLDCLDGDLARILGTTKLGRYLDRLLDRFVDFSVILAISAGFQLWFEGIILTFLSLMVSLTRLMAEKENVECKVGFAGRDIRIFFLAVSVIVTEYTGVILWVLIILSFLTVIQRIAHTLSMLNVKFFFKRY